MISDKLATTLLDMTSKRKLSLDDHDTIYEFIDDLSFRERVILSKMILEEVL